MMTRLFFLLFAMVLFVPAAQSSALGQAFDGLLANANGSVDGPGNFKTQARNITTFGSARVRFPTKTVNLFSYTPPSFSVGCNGIDINFGGFSYLNGSELEDLLKSLGPGTLVGAFNYAIRTACPICAAVMDITKKLSEFSRSAMVDSCQMGMALGEKLAKGVLGEPEDRAENSGKDAKGLTGLFGNFCSEESKESGAESDWYSASFLCNSFDKAQSAIKDFYDDWLDGNDNDKAKAVQKAIESPDTANSTWVLLQASGMTRDKGMAELFMSMMGTNIQGDPVPSTITYKDGVRVLLCGINTSNRQWTPAEEGVCTNIRTGESPIGIEADLDAITCAPEPGDNREKVALCLKVNPATPLTAWSEGLQTFGNEGLIKRVYDILENARKLAAGEPGGDESRWNEYLNLVNATPLPIYKIINMASVYPDWSKGFIEGYSSFIATHLAGEYVLHVIREAKRSKNKAFLDGLDPSFYSKMLSAMTAFVKVSQEQSKRLEAQLVRQQMLVAAIRDVQKIMENQVHSRGFSSSLVYVNDLSTRFGNMVSRSKIEKDAEGSE